MARRTLTETIQKLELRRDEIENKLSAHESYKALQAQGNQGARTEFTDPVKLEESLDKINNKLATLYRQKGI